MEAVRSCETRLEGYQCDSKTGRLLLRAIKVADFASFPTVDPIYVIQDHCFDLFFLIFFFLLPSLW